MFQLNFSQASGDNSHFNEFVKRMAGVDLVITPQMDSQRGSAIKGTLEFY